MSIKQFYAAYPSKDDRPYYKRKHYLEDEKFTDAQVARVIVREKPGCYLLKSKKKKYKIGVTGDLEKRLKELEHKCREKIEVVHFIRCDDRQMMYFLETLLHRRYKAKRMQGEWFDLDPGEVKNIVAIKTRHIKRLSQEQVVELVNRP